MILLDTSGVFAALVSNQRGHARAISVLREEPGPFVLSPFVLAELDYFLARTGGIDAELAFLGEVAAGAYAVAHFTSDDIAAAHAVIAQYRDLGIGLADASIVVLAGRYETTRLLTLDERHFRVLQTPSGTPFTILPADQF